MYVSYKLCTRAKSCSGARKQLDLYKKMRKEIPEWEDEDLLPDCETELTYHTSSGYLQAVLNFRNIRSSPGERKELSEEETKQIPKKIEDYIESLCNENHIELKKHDAGKEMDCERKGKQDKGEEYWCGMRNDEIVRVCSNGTRIAFEILDRLEKDSGFFKSDPSLSEHIKQEIVRRLRFTPDLSDCRFERTWHETCNSVGLGIYYDEDGKLWRSRGYRGLELIKERFFDSRVNSW